MPGVAVRRDVAVEGRRARTRDAICQAGLRLFAQHPVDSVSIDRVVAEAGVSKGSFYNHFLDRDELVQAVVGAIRAQLNGAVVEVNRGEQDAAWRMARAVSLFFRYAVDAPDAAAALVRIHGTEPSVQADFNLPLVQDLELGLSSGRFALPTLEAGVMFVVGVVQVGMARIAAGGNASLAVSQAQQLTSMLLRGLGVAGDEAARIAAQASDSLVRAGRTA